MIYSTFSTLAFSAFLGILRSDCKPWLIDVMESGVFQVLTAFEVLLKGSVQEIGPKNFNVEGEASEPNVVADDAVVEPVVEVSALHEEGTAGAARHASHAHD